MQPQTNINMFGLQIFKVEDFNVVQRHGVLETQSYF